MLGAGTTVKLFPLLATPATVTTTLPVTAPDGTFATMLVALHVVTVAVTPLNLTVLVPLVAPKAVPVIVTEAVIAPDVGARVAILGAAAATTGSHSSKSSDATAHFTQDGAIDLARTRRIVMVSGILLL